uniref:NADH-ubiquinone oxidoreductase chain 2 n=1 Tax=Dolichoderus quadripunctatus TaxID=609428 RepID=A0A6M8PN66_9HYME|nr:NADH dehydrogenase subunit 2 [Dolichoderus quadripunctatus]QKG63372.1 NADH dehydrogenase subunit 2 [Dolichoderus quadripunctatus]
MLLYNIFIKYFILMNMSILAILSLFMNDIMNIWFMMEINNFLFISYLSYSMKNKKMIFFYFTIQIIPSLMLILMIIMSSLLITKNHLEMSLLYISLMIKLGVPPFHFWMPLISMYMSWMNLFFLLTIQKIIPFSILSIMNDKNSIMLIMVILSSIIPPIMMLTQLKFKKILTYSSINQSSWMIMLIFMKNIFWIMYMINYMIITMLIFYFINFYKMSFNYLYLNFNTIMLMMMLNMAGTPPFSFFMFKWLSIFIFMFNSMKLFMLFMVMMISSLMMFFLYLRMMYMSMFLKLSSSKLIKMNIYYTNFNKSIIWILSMVLSLMIIMI